MDEQKLLSVDGVLRVSSIDDLQKHLEDNDYEVSVELWMLNEKKNRNGWIYKNTASHLRNFVGKPILISYKNNQLGAGHEMDEVRDENGNLTQSFMSASAERIVGILGDEIRLEKDEQGVEWVVGKGKIFGFYAPELARRLLGETGTSRADMRISIETLIYEMLTEGGVEIYTDWTVLGVTILGDKVTEAVAGANIRALAALTEGEIKEITLRVASAKSKKSTATQKTRRSKSMKLNDIKKQFANCTVLAVNGENVAMLDENGSPCVSTINEDGDNVVVGEIVKVNASVAFGDVEVPFEVYNSAMAEATAKVSELTTALSDKTEELDNAVKVIEAMKAAEKERRRNAVKNAVKERLASIREIHGDAVSENLCDDMLTDNALEEYCALEKDGVWCGLEAAEKEVKSRVMDKLLEAERKRANSAKKTYAWETNHDDSKPDGINAMFSRLGKATNN